MNELLRWLNQTLPTGPRTASNADALWLVLSLLAGLFVTTGNLIHAYRTDWARRRQAPHDATLRELAQGYVDKAWLFVGIDVACVAIGLWGFFGWSSFPAVFIIGIFALRILLSSAAIREWVLRVRVFRLGRVR